MGATTRNPPEPNPTAGPGPHDLGRETSFGQQGTSFIDRFGVWLSKRAIVSELPARGDLAALDLGCGYEATLLRAVRPHVARGVGVDISISESARAVPGLTFLETTAEQALASLDPNSFDVVLFISVLEHLRDPSAALRGCERVLRDGGVLLLNVPTWRGKTFLEFSAFRLGTSPACEMDDHKMYYDKRDLWPILVGAGFLPSKIRLRYHKFGLNLFAVVRKGR